MTRSRRQSTFSIFQMPTLIAALSLIGLISALTGDGVRDLVSWITLGVPVLTVVWAMRRRGPRADRRWQFNHRHVSTSLHSGE